MHAPRLSLSTLVTLLAATLVPAGDWARFRGPNGTGVSDDKDVPVKWSDDDVVFKTKLPGVGHSSPIVVKDRVYVQAATKAERLLLCHDANTGKLINPKGSHASATPCSDGERVYCVFWDGKRVALHAYGLDGKPAWKVDLGSFVSQHGPGFSPVVVEGKVIVNKDQDGAAELLAFDAKTGKRAWRVERPPFRACYSTPFVLGEGDARQLIVTSTAGITAYDPDSAKELWNYTWSFPGMALRTVASSVVADGMVFGFAGDGSGARGMIGVRLGGKGDVTKTNLVWSRDDARATPYVPTMVAYQGHLYGVLDEGQAICFDTKTGKEVWKARLTSSAISASPLLIDGKVFIFAEKGDAYVLAPTPEGLKVVARNKVGEPVMATPAVANGRLYVRGEGHLICIGKKAS
jgi:hypothetical protein